MASQTNPSSAGSPSATRVVTYVNQQLEKTRRQVRSTDLISALLKIFLFTVGFLMAVALWDSWVFPLSTVARWACLATIILFALYVLVTEIVPLLFRRINPEYAAKMIEDAEPSFKNSLLNFVFLKRKEEEISPAVFQAVSRQAASNLSSIPADATVDRSSLIRLGLYLIGLTMFIVLYMILSPKDPLQSFARVLLPNAKISHPARVRITEVLPADATVFFGDSLTVNAVVRGNHHPDDVYLILSSLDGQLSNQKLPMESDGIAGRYRIAIGETGGGIQQALRYQVVALDGSSPLYEIRVQSQPTIAVETLTVEPPKYTQLPPQTFVGQGEIDVIEGTRITVQAVANLPIKAAYLDLLYLNDNSNRDRTDRGTDRTEKTPRFKTSQTLNMEVNERTAKIGFHATLDASREKPMATHYQLRFISTDNDSNRKPNIYPLKIYPDLAPEIRILNPVQPDIQVPADGQMTVEVEANDLDFEISHLLFHLSHQGVQLRQDELELQPLNGNQRVRGRYRIHPQSLGLKPGDRAVFHASAADNRTTPGDQTRPDPNISRTDNYTLTITDPIQSNPDDPNVNNPASSDQTETTPDKTENSAGPPPTKNDPQNPDNRQPDRSTDPNQQKQQQQAEGNDASQPPPGQQTSENNRQSLDNATQDSQQSQQQNQQGTSGQGADDQSAQMEQTQGGEGQGATGQSNDSQSNDSQSNNSQSGTQNSNQQTGGNASDQGAGQQGDRSTGGEQQSSNGDPARQASSRNNTQQNANGNQNRTDSQSAQQSEGTTADQSGQGNSASQTTEGNSSAAEDSSAGSSAEKGQPDSSNSDPNASGNSSDRGEPAGEGSDSESQSNQRQPLSKEASQREQFERLQELLDKDPASPPGNSGSPPNQQQGTTSDSADPKDSSQSGNPQGDRAQKSDGENSGDNDPSAAQSQQSSTQNQNSAEGGDPSANPQSGDPQQSSDNSGKAQSQTTQSETDDKSLESGKQANPSEANAQNGESDPVKKNPGQQDSQNSQQQSESQSADSRQNSDSDRAGGDPSGQSGQEGQSGGGGKQSGQQGSESQEGQAGQSGEQSEQQQGSGNQNDAGQEGNSADSQNTDSQNSGSQNTDSQNSGSQNTDSQNSGSQNTDSQNSGSQNTESQSGQSAQQGSGDSTGQPQASDRQGGDSQGGNQAGSDPRNQGTDGQTTSPGRSAPGTGAGSQSSFQMDKEDPNLEHARQATDLILKKLNEQKYEPDPKLLEQMNWSQEDLNNFLKRWEEMKKAADQGDPRAQRRYEQSLRSLNFRSPAELRRLRQSEQEIKGLSQDSTVIQPPPQFAPDFQATLRDLNRNEN
jgi:hypothetical protein